MLITLLFSILFFNFYTPISDIDEVFYKPKYEVEVQENVIYGYGLSHDSYKLKNPVEIPLKLDAYVPKNDFKNRPILVLIHGGGFRSGDKKKMTQYIHFSKYFASRGFVVFNINYRLLKDYGSIPEEWTNYINLNAPKNDLDRFKAVYPAIRDAKAAIRWIVANKTKFGVNTNYLTVGGGSAGGCSAVAIGLTPNEYYRDELSVIEDMTLKTTNLNKNFTVKTILDFWGSKRCADAVNIIYGIKIYNKKNPSLFIAHGTNDDVVPYQRALDLKEVYKKSGAPHVLYPLLGKGHGPWKAKVGSKSLGDLAFEFITEQQGIRVKF